MDFAGTIEKFFNDPGFFKLLIAFVAAIAAAYVINFLLGKVVPFVTRLLVSGTSRVPTGDVAYRVRRTETIVSVGTGVLRAIIYGLCIYLAWKVVTPGNTPVAIIGAGTFFIVLGSVTIGPLLRDVTTGILMIAEQWYNVGDYVVVDPFWNLSGVVEQLNLRSTKLRSLNGEVVWIHNQHIQAVRVTPRGLRTISIDTFVNDLDAGRALLKETFEMLPIGPAMIVTPLEITEEEHLKGNWRITATGQTTPGREWLIEEFAVKALLKADSRNKVSVINYGPIARYTDVLAEKRFERSVYGARKRSAKK